MLEMRIQIELSRPITLPSPTITVHRDFELTNQKVFSPKGKLVIVDKKTTFGEKDRQYSVDRCSPTLLTDSRLWLEDIELKKSRKLYNEELAVLQGFPKYYKFYGGKGSVKRQIGNAVPPPVIKAFFSQISCEVLA